MPEKWLRILFRRRMLVAMLILLQAAFLIYIVTSSSRFLQSINLFSRLISLFVLFHIANRKDKGAYKLAWSTMVLLFPVLGGFFYLLFNYQTSTKRFRKEIAGTEQLAQKLSKLPGEPEQIPEQTFPNYCINIRYLRDYMGYPVYDHTHVAYLPSGEAMFERLLEDLKTAQQYIFLEFFIVREGVMWGSILEILKQKIQQGIKVRLLYDDVGCFFLLPKNYPKILQAMGMECSVFNPFRPLLTARQNNRDHRKIVSIDGRIAYTGGVNLADEYINVIEKHGHWKDTAVRLEGKAAWNFTLMFLQMWALSTHIQEDFAQYAPDEKHFSPETLGLVQPYADSPMDMDNVGEHVYLQIIQQAKDYVYITSPYLIVDDSTLSALRLAAQSGVDVRIITPHRWDKWFVHITTRSYYRDLIQAGVKVYEYSRGFIHAKTFVSDNHISTVGTTNLDFRSLYLHFECGTVLYGTDIATDIKEDFLKTMAQSKIIDLSDCKASLPIRLLQSILRIFAPLM